ncbi:hypothetical protein TIFTF001_008099 [Ficus carica]|uniref:Uncharacterized protein n=1 Tax=Ficus carica TaxID=3494 RepID=A0AA87ZMF6_FICCA|nr:hypothetical protein TIFTF001_008099 [Ficus carica]
MNENYNPVERRGKGGKERNSKSSQKNSKSLQTNNAGSGDAAELESPPSLCGRCSTRGSNSRPRCSTRTTTTPLSYLLLREHLELSMFQSCWREASRVRVVNRGGCRPSERAEKGNVSRGFLLLSFSFSGLCLSQPV